MLFLIPKFAKLTVDSHSMRWRLKWNKIDAQALSKWVDEGSHHLTSPSTQLPTHWRRTYHHNKKWFAMMVHCYPLAMMRSHINCFYYSVVAVFFFTLFERKECISNGVEKQKMTCTVCECPRVCYSRRSEKLFHFILYLMNTMLVRWQSPTIKRTIGEFPFCTRKHNDESPMNRENGGRQCNSEKMRTEKSRQKNK